MPIAILEEQRRFRELGRIRLGQREPVLIKSGPKAGQQAEKNGKLLFRPARLADFRLTSPWRHLLEAAQAIYGGEVKPWTPTEGRNEWELATGRPDIDVLVPPGDVLSQWMEEWDGGGCQRRCDGVRMIVAHGKSADRGCLCSPDGSIAIGDRKCKPTTRLLLMVPDLPDLGVWRVESHGINAALELGGAVELTELATRRGVIVPAVLRIEPRVVRKPGEPERRFVVPVLGFRHKLGDVFAALGFGDSGGLALLPGSDAVQVRPALNTGGTPELTHGEPTDAREAPASPHTIEAASLPTGAGGNATEAKGKTDETTTTATTTDEGNADIPDAEIIGEPEVFTPPAHDPATAEPTAPDGSSGAAMSPAQVIAMRARDAGVDDDTRHAVIGLVTRGRTRTGKEVTIPQEVQRCIRVLAELGEGSIKVERREKAPKAYVFTDDKGAVMELRDDDTIFRPDLGEHQDGAGNFAGPAAKK